MINIDKITHTANIISENDDFYKDNLVLVYYLDRVIHKKLDEHLYLKNQGKDLSQFEHGDVIEVEVNNVKFKFLIKDDSNV